MQQTIPPEDRPFLIDSYEDSHHSVVRDPFRVAWEAFAEKTYQINIDKGFVTDKQNVGEQIALMHSELSEALEAERSDKYDDKVPTRMGLEVELADVVIRIMNFGKHNNLDIAGAIVDKTAFNRTRAYKHGNKKF